MIKLAKGSTGNWMVMISPEEREALAAACNEMIDVWRQRREIGLKIAMSTGNPKIHDNATIMLQRLQALATSFGED